MSIQRSTIVVLIPCLNEEITIGKVIRDFQKSIPEAQIIVFDNNVPTVLLLLHMNQEQK